MTSLIEQAAQRLEQLRQAGVAIPDVAGPAVPQERPAPAPERVEPVATSRRVELKLDELNAAGIVTPNSPRTVVADQFRVIKRPLIANAVGKGAAMLKHGNLIMVTSAVAGEGKSFTSVNLAMSIAAELDHTVVLVDADVARPSLLRVLGLPPSAGLLDVLEGKAELSDVLLRTNVDKLTVLPSGTPHAKATELLASEGMARLLDEMATRYPDRIIIFDSPPLLLTTESRVLASHMGQIVVVVAAGRTHQSAVQQALDTIDACPVRLLVLNKARTDAVGYGAGQGYGYGYGYGYGQDAEAGSEGEASEPAAPKAGD
ncbi:XrtA-associated tyrosine autokinase [Rubrivivax gelatinosus]|uniref:non-specific protein-tyrosine kinase n=1 Tax=Rubrivivax gelatinosus (strain NBRC 100245 / IL144) TaxID=983917 RepID=I0HL68_RUBGI|nr:XrtA-associated tyrosine autokinase [Rubrivivax gelatinosus]BAL93755.1 protein-tyrosine kinase [Rubrivivax gelatinosus IL144]